MDLKFKIAMNPSVGRHIWFTSDPHYGHANILKYSKRPFADPQEMDAFLIKNWNAVVRPDDYVWMLGDFAMTGKRDRLANYLSQLNGEKYAIFGNHDVGGLYADAGLQREFFKGCFDLKQIKIEDPEAFQGYQRITLCHYSMRVWNKSHHGAYHLYGHSHGSLPEDEGYLGMDVGVDPTAWRLNHGYEFPNTREAAMARLKNLKAEDMTKDGYRPLGYYEIKAIMAKRKFAAADHHGMAD